MPPPPHFPCQLLPHCFVPCCGKIPWAAIKPLKPPLWRKSVMAKPAAPSQSPVYLICCQPLLTQLISSSYLQHFVTSRTLLSLLIFLLCHWSFLLRPLCLFLFSQISFLSILIFFFFLVILLFKALIIKHW